MYTTCYIVFGFLLLQLQTTIVNADGDTDGKLNRELATKITLL